MCCVTCALASCASHDVHNSQALTCQGEVHLFDRLQMACLGGMARSCTAKQGQRPLHIYAPAMPAACQHVKVREAVAMVESCSKQCAWLERTRRGAGQGSCAHIPCQLTRRQMLRLGGPGLACLQPIPGQPSIGNQSHHLAAIGVSQLLPECAARHDLPKTLVTAA